MTDYLDEPLDLEDPGVAAACDEVSLWSARFGLPLLDRITLRAGLAVLDIGCGTGFPILELAQMLGRGSRLTGVDLWAAGLARAERKRRTLGIRNARLLQADAARLPIADAQFDLLVCHLGVNNFSDPAAVFAECARVARRGAMLVLTTNLVGHFHEFYGEFRTTLVELGLDACLARLDAQEAHRGTQHAVQEIVKRAGFRVDRRVEDTFSLRYLDGAALLRHGLTRIGFLDGWRRVVSPADERRVFAALEQRMDARSRQMGELRMSVPTLYLEAERI